MIADPAAAFDVRLYRAALRLCPGEFRREHAGDMALDFEDARQEATASGAGAGAVWTLRLLLGVDLARTIVVQWLRTGFPVIACAAALVSLSMAAALASVTRAVTRRLSAVTGDMDTLGVILLAAVVVMVIVATIVFNHWVHRPRPLGRR
jgi:hypothetical protein